MNTVSPSIVRVNNFIYGDGEEQCLSENEEPESPDLEASTTGQSESMYVTLFEDALKAVLLHEPHLFSPRELVCFMRYNDLSYKGRYLLIRLCLRKNDKWHRLSDLKYRKELGDDIPDAIRELCHDSKKTSHYEEVKPEVIDLTVDEYLSQSEPGPSKLPPLPSPLNSEPNLDVFADDHSHATIRELLVCLTLSELRAVAKQVKSTSTGTRDMIIKALLENTSNQSTLQFPACSGVNGSSKGKKSGGIQSKIAFSSLRPKLETQLDRLRVIVMKVLEHCIRLNSEIVKLFQRVNLVYFRHTQHTPTFLTPSILAKARKRTYANYITERTLIIWPTRDALIEYEKALELEAQVDALLDGLTSFRGRSRTAVSKTPVPRTRSRPATESPSKRRSTRSGIAQEDAEYDPVVESPRVQAARGVLVVFEEVYPKWERLVAADNDSNNEERWNSIRRFECGHVFTRIVCKGADAYGILKQYDDELRILDALLAQKKWRRGRRGGWHERKALILMTHMGNKDITLEKARQAVLEGFRDDDTHIVYRISLERRLTRLENKLKLPKHERHECTGKLKEANQERISGVRVHHTATSLKLDKSLKPIVNPQVKPASDGPKMLDLALLKPPNSAANTKPGLERRHSGKSIWRGRDEEEVTVEIFAQQHYEDQGFKGFHCEGRITAYQSAPLDIAEDTFYLSRKSLIDQRLQEIRDGMAPEIIEQNDDQHRPSQTWCVGVRWDLFEKQDLVEIAECIGGDGMATICQLMCEDYASRTSGVPDLIIWNAEESTGKFVEVKGPGDSLQENQKVWVDVLVRAGVPVDVCHVAEQGEDTKPKSKGKAKKAAIPKSTRKRKRHQSPELESESSEEETVPINFDVKSEDEEEPPPPSQASTQVETVIRTRDEEGSCFIPATPFDSRETLVNSPSRTLSPRPFKRLRPGHSP
ncbi:hypothetical protein QCA50_003602 [Cerrena zonata]|uniref:Fanconi-associated nuclease n=1 Tax=Cerrena zonata TaxID=2478898 RepID=A0AAW0GKR7_9APHY